MKYLFFDIECANCFGGHGKICSFGYVLADENLNIIEQQDIVINPKAKFHLKRGGSEEIQLSYSQEEFLNAPAFDFFYDTISQLLQNPNYICFGHSVKNDLNFIMSECKRYGLKCIDMKAYDTQILYKFLKKQTVDAGLEKICMQYSVDTSHLHRSDYDAYLTLNVFNKLCQEYCLSPTEMLNTCPNAYYTVVDGKLKNHYQTVNYSKQLIDFAKRVRPFEFLVNQFSKDINPSCLGESYFFHKELVYFNQVNISQKRKAPNYSGNLNTTISCYNNKPQEVVEQLSKQIWGKSFCFNQKFEIEEYKKCLFLVKHIRLLGGYYCNKVSKSDYFVKGIEGCTRQSQLEGFGTESSVVTVDEKQLCGMLEIDYGVYNAIDSSSITKIKQLTIKTI